MSFELEEGNEYPLVMSDYTYKCVEVDKENPRKSVGFIYNTKTKTSTPAIQVRSTLKNFCGSRYELKEPNHWIQGTVVRLTFVEKEGQDSMHERGQTSSGHDYSNTFSRFYDKQSYHDMDIKTYSSLYNIVREVFYPQKSEPLDTWRG